ncbi:hypothetical protein [Luteimonas changyuni]|uniref:hypothetical protein n=1 Tax=Luteimonas sp. MJ145 TaxID=3129234 RepID=UPI0031BAD8C7
MASEMVLAYGDHGLEPTSAGDVVEVPVMPETGGAATPAVLRLLNRGGGVPTRLLRVERPSARNGRRHVLVRFECTPFAQYTRPDGMATVLLYEWGCEVRNFAEARDPLFAGLTERERGRIARAVAAAEEA